MMRNVIERMTISPEVVSDNLVRRVWLAFRGRGRVLNIDQGIPRISKPILSERPTVSVEMPKPEPYDVHVFTEYFGHGWKPQDIRAWQQSFDADGDNAYLLASVLAAPRDGWYITVPNRDEDLIL